METFATQDVTDNTISDEEMVIESFWARLFSLGSSFNALGEFEVPMVIFCFNLLIYF